MNTRSFTSYQAIFHHLIKVRLFSYFSQKPSYLIIYILHGYYMFVITENKSYHHHFI